MRRYQATRTPTRVRALYLSALPVVPICTLLSSAAHASADIPDTTLPRERITVTASRTDPIGHATTASQGHITSRELELRPVYRVGQLLESVPGLVVTAHSGEGKANQYLLRGFNLDHGTDLASFVDDMPVNEPTHAHGQGYTDINFLIPELANGVDYTKGPFFAQVGDFGVVGSDHITLRDAMPRQVMLSAGTLGDQRIMAADTLHFHNGDRLLGILSAEHLDGPWTHPDNFRGLKSALRWSHERGAHTIHLTAMVYRGQWSSTTDQPVAARTSGLIGRYGSLDPTDGGFSERFSVSAHHRYQGAGWGLDTAMYVTHSRLTLWNDFTHYLVDPVNGDQEQQDETRTTVGGQSAFHRTDRILGFAMENTLGVQGRWDTIYIDRRHTRARQALEACPDSAAPTGAYVCNADRVQQGNAGLYGQNVTHWMPWLRTVVGLRGDFYGGRDHSLVSGYRGRTHQWLFQPKGSLIVGPWRRTEFYASVGRGYHSNDLRAVLGTVPTDGIAGGRIATPFMTRATSEEVGLRSDPLPGLSVQAALYRIDFTSELTYDADEGVNEAGAPSRRTGVEVSAQYRPFRWVEINGDVAAARARYRTSTPQAYGIDGLFIANAPRFIASFGILLDHLGPWYGSAQMRWLGGYPLIEDDSLRSPGYREVNVSIGRHLGTRTTLQVSVYNLFNTHAAASQYAYAYRMTPTSAEETGATFHPLEPLSARFSVTRQF
ncbi:TonB-dependent receptor [Ameyamaea chiangmaiensis]|uniref:TonB-dependent receptor n=1 Tax=Ameyamaea chiangmaiensis TaxID=442969 RepID=A0A850PD47_9PROT|nr:TonB-dependent receptor plug domain-containing protein [Ameyamaea chiangmaiensis]NVN40823.1 TonB-dependent receptor [Ameyamaea chiangmaiensis]